MRSTPQSEERRLERLAKNMIVSRDIPPAKMEAVRALLENPTLNPKEKYTTIIELIRPCPDKRPVAENTRPAAKSAPSARPTASPRTASPIPAQSRDTLYGAEFVDAIYNSMKPHGLFQKRLLIKSSNPLGFWFKKRLVPSPRFFKAFSRINSYQELLLLRLPAIMQKIVEDPDIEDPTVYNHLRLLQKWLMDTPFAKLNYQTARWLDAPNFEAELKQYIKNYLFFERMESGLKERIILTFEDKLRVCEDLIKSPDAEGSAVNLKREKEIFNYLSTLRSFLPTPAAQNGAIDSWLRAFCGINSLGEFLVFTVEALISKRRVEKSEIGNSWNIGQITVNGITWDCGVDVLKKAGKDEISLRLKRAEYLKNALEPYDQLLELVTIKIDGRQVLEKAFDEHWHIISKRRSEYADFYQNNFFYFLDDCVDYFIHAYIPFLDGSPFLFLTPDKKIIESSIFSTGYFEAKISSLYDLQGQLHDYRTANPNQMIAYDEIRRIMSGRLATMVHVKVFIEHIGAIFYSFASELFAVYREHFIWALSGAKAEGYEQLRSPLLSGQISVQQSEKGSPLPFYDALVARSDKMTPILRTFIGKRIMSDSIQTGIFKMIIAFCYQMAAECMHPELERELEKRREIKNQIALLGERK